MQLLYWHHPRMRMLNQALLQGELFYKANSVRALTFTAAYGAPYRNLKGQLDGKHETETREKIERQIEDLKAKLADLETDQ